MGKVKGLVFGVGVNDADYTVCKETKVNGKRVQVVCPFYRAWTSMHQRCEAGGTSQRDSPTYIGCSVDPRWHLLSTFKEWMIQQDWQGNQLDKDVLVEGNKVYSPDTCVFISPQLNKFMNSYTVKVGNLPLGVSFHKQRNKFQGSCCNPFTGKRDHIGLYDTAEKAHEEWRKRKHELACIYADQQTDPRVANALRTRYMEANKV